MARIFWVEDQSHWIDKFKQVLEESAFDGSANELSIFKFAEAAQQKIALTDECKRPDIALLDARINGRDEGGLSVFNALMRKWPDLPVLFLSEHSGTELEKVALEHHALDFISKHQRNVDEVLCWRIKAALRQRDVRQTASGAEKDRVLASGDLRIDIDNWEAYWKGRKLMNPANAKRPLAPTPRKILRCLVERSPRPVTTNQIAEHLGLDPDTYAHATYRQHVKTLRTAIDRADGGNGVFLQQCQNGFGIATCREDGAYCWKRCSYSESK
ncbi:MAG: response regulator transcription factor [Gammaproteobacteria bacterium]|nr:response regulator transcription factor [Gammaproteobacteria bacterium]